MNFRPLNPISNEFLIFGQNVGAEGMKEISSFQKGVIRLYYEILDIAVYCCVLASDRNMDVSK